jgi:hypothetical protein
VWDGEKQWGEFSWLRDEDIVWKKGLLSGWSSSHKGHRLKLRLNNFPDEPMWTFFVNGRQIVHFDDCPGSWSGLR